MGKRVVQKRVVTPAACMRRKRQALYDADFVQSKLQIPISFAERLKELKAAYKMRGLDNVVSAMIRKAMANYSPDDLLAPPPPEDHMNLKQIAIHIPREHHAFLEAVAHRNRGITLGTALETIGAHVKDLTPVPVQLSLIEEGDAVSG
jgi:hypothetical protein